MPASERFDLHRLRGYREVLVRRHRHIRERLHDPARPKDIRYRFLADGSLELAAIAILLNEGEDAVRSHIEEAVDAARGWIAAPTTPSPPLQTWSIDAAFDGHGNVDATFTDLISPQPPQGSKDGWHIDLYNGMLQLLVAFGTSNAAREAATAPEEWYRSAEVLAEEAYFAEVRGRKHWLLGEDEAARAASREAMRRARDASIKAAAAALLALMEGKERAFRAGLADLLKAHKKSSSRDATQLSAAFSLDALALCRVARTYGLEMPEEPYLPTRFLAPGTLRDR